MEDFQSFKLDPHPKKTQTFLFSYLLLYQELLSLEFIWVQNAHLNSSCF